MKGFRENLGSKSLVSINRFFDILNKQQQQKRLLFSFAWPLFSPRTSTLLSAHYLHYSVSIYFITFNHFIVFNTIVFMDCFKLITPVSSDFFTFFFSISNLFLLFYFLENFIHGLFIYTIPGFPSTFSPTPLTSHILQLPSKFMTSSF